MIYDVIVIGGGIAGVTSAMYCKYFGITNVLVLEEDQIGGKLNFKTLVDNIPFNGPSYSSKVMVNNLTAQMENWEVEKRFESVKSIKLDGNLKKVVTANLTYTSKAIIYCAGLRLNRLDVPGDREYQGRGVYYMSNMKKATFETSNIAIIGGGRAAQEYLLKSDSYKQFKHAYLITEGKLQNIATITNQVKEMKNTTIIENVKIAEVLGDSTKVIGLTYLKDNKLEELEVAGIFPLIGSVPDIKILESLNLKLSPKKYIVTNAKMETSVPGIFAAGDITLKDQYSLLTASADANLAGINAATYVRAFDAEVANRGGK